MNKYDIIQNAIDALNRGKKCPLLPHTVTKEDIIKMFFPELPLGGEFDYAIPLEWSNHVSKVTGKDTRLFVWYYPKHRHFFGIPVPLSRDAINTLKEYNTKTGANYPVPSE